MDSKKRVYNENPYTEANVVSKVFFRWIDPLLTLGRKQPLTENDLYRPLSYEESKYLTDKLETEWDKELKKNNPNLLRALVRLYWFRFLLACLCLTIKEIGLIATPIFLNLLLKYFKDQLELEWAIGYGFLTFLSTLLYPIAHHPQFFAVVRYGMQIRTAVCTLAYKKLLKVGVTNTDKSNIEFLNLLSTDATRLEYSTWYLNYLIIGPIKAVAIIAILYAQVNESILSGLLLFVLFIPLQGMITRFLGKYKMKTAKITDERVKLTSEVLNGMKVIKMYTWEDAFKTLIKLIRMRELRTYAVIFVITAMNNLIEGLMPQVITFVCVIVFTLTTSQPLISNYIILIISYSGILGQTFGFDFMRGLSFLISAKVSLKRIQNYLLQAEVMPKSQVFDKSQASFLRVRDLNASWSHNENEHLLKNISFCVESNKLLAVVGTVGSGKTSLLMALLGEMPVLQGNVNINGKIFYVSQEPWIFTATIRQNILFGKEYDQEKFNIVVKACELEQDFATLPYSDLTYIGDKGVNLSGGQRARISLARAVYADADIYLLDDPLSAVDANVGRQLYTNCINGYLNGKIRILVTHQVHFLTDADEIIFLKDGCIAGKGTYDELMTQSEEMSRLKLSIQSTQDDYHESEQTEKAEKVEEKHTTSNNDIDNSAESNTKNKEYEENRETGNVTWKIYSIYFKSVLGYVGPIFLVALCTIAQGLVILSDYWASLWSNTEEVASNKNRTFEVERNDYMKSYSIIISFTTLVMIARSLIFYGFCVLASKSLHGKMLNSVMQTKIRFFDLNPIGRIMNRFSKDIGSLDDVLPVTLFDFAQCTMRVLGAVVLTLIINYFALIPIMPIIAVFVYIRSYYASSSREIKRIEGLCRSPIFVHATNTSAGVVTIRACNNEEILQQEFNIHCDYHTQAYFAYTAVGRWFAIRLDLIVAFYTLFIIYVYIFSSSIVKVEPSSVGLALVYILQALGAFQWGVRQSTEVENLMTSVERINEYVTLQQEPLKEGSIRPPSDWPQNGEVTFENVSFAYDQGLPNVLKNVTFKINAKEKIGVVGRTGAGKSTIFQTLFRMAEPDGTVLIDGINIKEISLHDLRSKISIIPQEPTLFIGPLRYNLDPFGDYDDQVLWDTLDTVQLKDAVKSMQGGLDAQIQKGGSNLSVGQKQLICLARAILKKSKILIIDEATANVDYKTDELVQKAIRECFGECTVITIAHRLHTIMDTDKIICLSDGQLVSMDSPINLLRDQNSILNDFVKKLNHNEATHLYEIAFEHEKSKNQEFNISEPDCQIHL